MTHPLIENYRGYEIFFNPEQEKFYSNVDTIGHFEKQSFAAAKKFLDEYIKDNSKFEPFYVVKVGGMFQDGRKIKIIGIRKDERFIYEDEKGKKDQMSDYNEKDYILDLPENEKHFANIAIYEAEAKEWQDKAKNELKLINKTTLADIKEKYLPK